MPTNLSIGVSLGGVTYRGVLSAVTQKVAVVLAGQSNVIGNNTSDGTLFPSGVEQYDQTGALVAPTSPLDHFITTAANVGSIGPGPFFSIERQAIDSADIILIPCAEGGSGFANNRWNPGDDLYNATVSRVNAFAAANPSVPIIGFYFGQGEADALAGSTQAQYETAATAFATSLRTDAPALSSTPIIWQEIGVSTGGYPTRDDIRAAQRNLPNLVANSFCLRNWGIMEDSPDNIHQGPLGQHRVGLRLANIVSDLGRASGGAYNVPGTFIRDPSFDLAFDDEWYRALGQFWTISGGQLVFDPGTTATGNHNVRSKQGFYAESGVTYDITFNLATFSHSTGSTTAIRLRLVEFFSDLSSNVVAFANLSAPGSYTYQYTGQGGVVYPQVQASPGGDVLVARFDSIEVAEA